MLIPVNFSPSSSLTAGYPKLAPALAKVSHNEIILLEFQGEFEVETVTSDRTERNGKVVGTLSIDDDMVSVSPQVQAYCGLGFQSLEYLYFY
jgi:chromosome transmission fidelity protein 8